MQPHRRQPTGLPRPWNSPGKNTGVGCHTLLQRIFPTQGSSQGASERRGILWRWRGPSGLRWVWRSNRVLAQFAVSYYYAQQPPNSRPQRLSCLPGWMCGRGGQPHRLARQHPAPQAGSQDPGCIPQPSPGKLGTRPQQPTQATLLRSCPVLWRQALPCRSIKNLLIRRQQGPALHPHPTGLAISTG